jgi:hypothetical protein
LLLSAAGPPELDVFAPVIDDEAIPASPNVDTLQAFKIFRLDGFFVIIFKFFIAFDQFIFLPAQLE